ncbi:MAG: serine/threonine-protein kinase [Wenzhouxiangella sp.]|jgi:serine/threonine-protein kinase|nr:serine/threonine-protein kinase [Wenzhouxiangella sp.]
MTSPTLDWQRLDRAIQAAMAVTEADRDAVLSQVLADRPDLLAMARAALADNSHVASIAELAPQLIDAIDSAEQARADSRLAGRRLGPWRILRPLGRGGMGSVYLGERADGVFSRQVAIKLLPWALHNPELVNRFERERNILAGLNHPGIAQLLDGGTMEDGSPYLVLEYVDGECITDYCDRLALNLEQRIELLVEVMRVVQFAHRNLVVHRDLKPANIMVDREGRIKLLDFGIAKLLEDVGDGELTGPLGARLTPDYAAPEQLLGQRVTAASDVYALGCLAYRLLCGRVPLELTGRSLGQMVQSVQSLTRPSLSQVAASSTLPAGINPSDFSRDLDAIGGKALQPDAEQRYGTVAEFQADLQRFQDGLPVSAHAAGSWYRAGKFIARHRAGFTMTVLAFTVLATTAAVALFQAEQARQQRDEAQAITTVLKDLMQLADPDAGMGHRIDARSILNTAVDKVIHEVGARPETRVELLEKLADALIAFELADDALRARHVIHSLQLERFGPDHPDTLSALRGHAMALREQRRHFQQTEQMFLDLLERRRSLHGEDHPDTAESYWDLGFLYLRYSDSSHPGRQSAPGLIAKAHEIYTQTLGPSHLLSARTLFDLGLATQDIDLKIERMRRGVEIRASQVDPEDLQLLQHQGDLAMVLSAAGHAEEGLEMGRRATEGYQLARGELHPVAIILLNNLAGMYRDHQRYPEALATYRRVDEVVRAVVPEDHLRRAYSQYGIGRTLNALARPAEAEPFLREALRILEANQQLNLIGITRIELGDCLLAQQRRVDAAGEYEQAVSIYTGQLGRGEDDPQVSAIRQRLAAL